MKKSILYLTLLLFLPVFIACSNKEEAEGNLSEGRNLSEAKDTKDTGEGSGRQNSSGDGEAYIGKTDVHGILVQDNYVVQLPENKDYFNFSEYGIDYEKYSNYIKDILKKYKESEFSEEKTSYIIDDYVSEFGRLTDLKRGDKFYISIPGNVLEGDVGMYFIELEDEIGSGNIFYPVLVVPNASMLKADETVIVSKNKDMSAINNTKITDQALIGKFANAIKPLVKGVEEMEYKDGVPEPVGKPVEVKAEDITVFEGSFSGSGSNEYLVGYVKRLSFEAFVWGLFVMDSNGNIVETVQKITPNSFEYGQLYGIIDYDGDGKYEFILETGYYEGAGMGLYKVSKEGMEMLANGFFFGV